ncbi:MAG: branched-chain amino acid ABC transporter permease [Dehalococcoidia bacterium]|nr:branched-chain amino acid ABC transporter permease [Dehalococcoidia bacterium]
MIPPLLMSFSVYASLITILAIGYTLTYIISHIPNFAHGTYAGLGIYTTYTLTRVMRFNPYISCPVGFVVGGIMGLILYIIVIKTLRMMGGSLIVLTIATLAIQITMDALINIYATFLRIRTESWAFMFVLKLNDFKWLGYQGIFPVSLLLCITIVIILHLFLTRTKMGIAMRATSENVELAQVVGIDADLIQMLSWFITGGLASLSGTLFPLWFECNPSTANRLINVTMAGSLFGGINNIYGAIIGGFFVGATEIIGTTALMYLFGPIVGEYRYMIPLVVVILVLLLEPQGVPGIIKRIRDSTKFASLYSRRRKW